MHPTFLSRGLSTGAPIADSWRSILDLTRCLGSPASVSRTRPPFLSTITRGGSFDDSGGAGAPARIGGLFEDNAISERAFSGRMVPPKESEPALAAPGVENLLSTPQQSLAGRRSTRRPSNVSYSHVRLEFDLAPEPPKTAGVPLLERLARFVGEQRVVEQGTLTVLAAATLHAVAAQRFRRVDHWEVTPGGWLPPPRPGTDPDSEEPVGHLLHALESGAGSSVSSAHSFSARLSDLSGGRVDLTLRRVHRESRHSLTIDLWGRWTKGAVKDLEGSISERLPVTRTRMTKFQYA